MSHIGEVSTAGVLQLKVSVYFLWLVKPVQAYDYIGQAAHKIQKLIYMYAFYETQLDRSGEIWVPVYRITRGLLN